MNNKPIPLFWWNERILQNQQKENYGDLLSKYLVEKISGRQVKWIHPKKRPWYKRDHTHYLTIGSIIHHCTKKSIVWGSGIIDRKQPVAGADFRAVRGPQTKAFLNTLGFSCPEIYGDPALLMPLYFNPKIDKKYKVGIVPHYHDYQQICSIYRNSPDVLIINLRTLDIENVTLDILKCEKIISSSLHGLIVAHAYNIPAIWVRFSDKLFGDNVKFRDYLDSVKIHEYIGDFVDKELTVAQIEGKFQEFEYLPSVETIKEIQQNLLSNCPFI